MDRVWNVSQKNSQHLYLFKERKNRDTPRTKLLYSSLKMIQRFKRNKKHLESST